MFFHLLKIIKNLPIFLCFLLELAYIPHPKTYCMVVSKFFSRMYVSDYEGTLKDLVLKKIEAMSDAEFGQPGCIV